MTVQMTGLNAQDPRFPRRNRAMNRSTGSTVRRPTVTRIGWLAVAALLLACTVFEAGKRGGATVATAILGGVGPDVLLGIGQPHRPRSTAPPGGPRRQSRAPPAPALAVVTFFSLIGDSAAGFTFGLAWLTHIAVDRACGYVRRDPDGSVRPRQVRP
jgi:hypothetical protein